MERIETCPPLEIPTYYDFRRKMENFMRDRPYQRMEIKPATTAAWYAENFNPFDALFSAGAYGNY